MPIVSRKSYPTVVAEILVSEAGSLPGQERSPDDDWILTGNWFTVVADAIEEVPMTCCLKVSRRGASSPSMGIYKTRSRSRPRFFERVYCICLATTTIPRIRKTDRENWNMTRILRRKAALKPTLSLFFNRSEEHTSELQSLMRN